MMETLYAVAQRIGATLEGANVGFNRVNTDTRTLTAGDLFVALKGENFDGHEFVARAAESGAVGALVSRHIDCALPQIIVKGDTLTALQEYAASWRNDFDLPVVAVTGSNGKTTTKQMLSSIFAARGPVLATQGNLNNHIGLPLTLLSLRREHKTAVIEMGANHLGEIELLTRLTRPNVGVITQAGDAHLEGFGSREGVARGKGELFAGLSGGVAVINADDVYAPLWRELAVGASVITFGFSVHADVSAIHVQPFPLESPVGTHFELRAPEGGQTVNLPLPGRHNVSNALGAAACAVALGMDLKDIAAGLARMDAPQGRLSWKTTPEDARLLDDSYNANPTSLQAAMETLAALSGERVLVLGGMAELGADAPQLHHAAGKAAKALRINRLYTLGPLAAEAARGFGEGAEAFEDFKELAAALRPHLNKNVALLVKGSRSSRMERVVAALTGQDAKGAH